MINNLSEKLTEKLLSSGSINEDDRELYVYGFFMLLSQLMYLIFSCILGLIFGCILESIIFYVAFQLIRRYAGGYHASTEARCEIMSSFSILISILVIWLSKSHNFQTILFAVSIAAMIFIFCLCPLDTPEKPLSEKEFKYFRKISWIILLIISIIIVVSYFLKFSFLLAPCCMSLILESILLIAGKTKKLITQKKEQV